MAISLEPDTQGTEFEDEFEPNTVPSPFRAKDGLDKIRIDYTPGDQVIINDLIAGKSAPSATIGVAENVTSDSFEMNANISNYGGAGLECSYFFQWNTEDSWPPGPGGGETPVKAVQQSGNVSEVVDGDDGVISSQDYVYRFKYWNGFNQHSQDRYVTATESVETDSEQQQLTQPGIVNCGIGSFSRVTAEWNYNDIPDQFTAQVRVNGGTPAETTVQTSTNWGDSADPKTGAWVSDEQFEFNDMVEIRIKAEAPSSSYQDSLFSPWCVAQTGS